MRIISTYFKRKEIHKGTWLIPGRNETKQIDHVLIKKNESMNINVKSCRGEEADSDHCFVEIRLKQRNGMKNKQVRHNIEVLQNKEVA